MSPSSATRIVPARSTLHRIAAIVRRIIGAPDYDAYLDHMQRCHPDRVPVNKREFEQQRLDARYNTPGNRCC